MSLFSDGFVRRPVAWVKTSIAYICFALFCIAWLGFALLALLCFALLTSPSKSNKNTRVLLCFALLSIAWLCFALLALLCFAVLTSPGKSNKSTKSSSRKCRRSKSTCFALRCFALLGFAWHCLHCFVLLCLLVVVRVIRVVRIVAVGVAA